MSDIFNRPIIIAADVNNDADLLSILTLLQSDPHTDQTGGNPNVMVKVGLEFVLTRGVETLATLLRPYHPPLMLDLKLADIGNTNAKALESILKYITPAILTVSGLGAGSKGIRAVRDVIDKAQIPTKLVATTILTNWDDDDVIRTLPGVGLMKSILHQGMGSAASHAAFEAGKMALSNGAHGTVSSGYEASNMRGLGAELVITPGIRPTWAADKGDQARVMTPAEAFAEGSTHLVIGRPVLQAHKFGLTPAQAIDKLVAERPKLAA